MTLGFFFDEQQEFGIGNASWGLRSGCSRCCAAGGARDDLAWGGGEKLLIFGADERRKRKALRCHQGCPMKMVSVCQVVWCGC